MCVCVTEMRTFDCSLRAHCLSSHSIGCCVDLLSGRADYLIDRHFLLASVTYQLHFLDCLRFSKFYWVLLCFTVFYWVLLGFTVFFP